LRMKTYTNWQKRSFFTFSFLRSLDRRDTENIG
jgi:hypothetical protein